MTKKPSVAIVGAGMGGLAVAATLRRAGFDVAVYEQAARFARIGAGIQMMPNSMKVLREIGIDTRPAETAVQPHVAKAHAVDGHQGRPVGGRPGGPRRKGSGQRRHTITRVDEAHARVPELDVIDVDAELLGPFDDQLP